MKKSKALAAAMASLLLTGTMKGCSFNPGDNQEEDVYGPPQPYEEPVDEPVEEAEESSFPDTDNPSGSETAVSDDYNAEVNMEPGVYGPPSVFGASPDIKR